MICDRSILLEAQTPINSLVIPIPLIIVGKTCSQMSGDEANARVREVKTNGTASFVARNS